MKELCASVQDRGRKIIFTFPLEITKQTDKRYEAIGFYNIGCYWQTTEVPERWKTNETSPVALSVYFHKRDSRPHHREDECKENLVVCLSWGDSAESREAQTARAPWAEPWRGGNEDCLGRSADDCPRDFGWVLIRYACVVIAQGWGQN